MSRERSRRELLRALGQAGLVLGASGLAAGLGIVSPGRWRERAGAAIIPDRAVTESARWPRAVVAHGPDPGQLVRAAVDAVGGIGRFVQPGESVLLKPNMAWDRTPEQGANTNPEVVAAMVHLCREARAGRVIVAEVPVHDPARTQAVSGIGAAARAAGAELLLPPGAGFRLAALGGTVLAEWEVLEPLLEVDRVINLPVVKHHGLSRLTCGLKNWYGLLGGTRARLHQRIHEAVADLAVAFHPTLTVVDAVRVLMRSGPQGGRLEDVRRVDAVAAGTDPVALDAWAATMLGVDPREIGYLALASGRGLGRNDPKLVEVVRG